MHVVTARLTPHRFKLRSPFLSLTLGVVGTVAGTEGSPRRSLIRWVYAGDDEVGHFLCAHSIDSRRDSSMSHLMGCSSSFMAYS